MILREGGQKSPASPSAQETCPDAFEKSNQTLSRPPVAFSPVALSVQIVWMVAFSNSKVMFSEGAESFEMLTLHSLRVTFSNTSSRKGILASFGAETVAWAAERQTITSALGIGLPASFRTLRRGTEAGPGFLEKVNASAFSACSCLSDLAGVGAFLAFKASPSFRDS